MIQTGPSLKLKLAYPDGTEKTVGYANGLTYTVSQGQKATFVVDSPFPAEISQGASPSIVTGTITTFLPKGMTPESAGLVSYRADSKGEIYMGLSKYINIRLYDRLSGLIVMSADFCKIGNYTVSVRARGVVQMNFNFEGMLLTPGNPA